MTNSELERNYKKRTFRCSNAEWEKITQSAEKMNMSASRFIVEKVCSEGDSDVPQILENILPRILENNIKHILENDLNRILSCSRLLAFDLMDRLRAGHSEDDYNLLLARTKFEHMSLDEIRKMSLDESDKEQTEKHTAT